MIFQDGMQRYEKPEQVSAPPWATHTVTKREVNDSLGFQVWWFVNFDTKQWTHYNTNNLYGRFFTGFLEDVTIESLNISLENK